MAVLESAYNNLSAEDKRRTLISNNDNLVVRNCDFNHGYFNSVSIVSNDGCYVFTFNLLAHTVTRANLTTTGNTFTDLSNNINANKLILYLA